MLKYQYSILVIGELFNISHMPAMVIKKDLKRMNLSRMNRQLKKTLTWKVLLRYWLFIIKGRTFYLILLQFYLLYPFQSI